MRIRAILASMIGAAIDRARRVRQCRRRPECRHDASAPAATQAGGIGGGLRRAAIPWTADLAKLDESVRRHPSGAVHDPSGSRVDRQARGAPPVVAAAAPDEQLVQLASLVGLLDTHSYLDWRPDATFYEVLVYPFSDGVFAIRAKDPSLVGARLVSIGGVPVAKVQERLAPLVPHDNESGLLDGIQGLLSSVEYLHGAGIVADPAEAAVRLRATGRRGRSSVDPGAVESGRLGARARDRGRPHGRQAGSRRPADGAGLVARRGQGPRLPPVLQRLRRSDEGARSDEGGARHEEGDRVVLDLRYLRGGNGPSRSRSSRDSPPNRGSTRRAGSPC